MGESGARVAQPELAVGDFDYVDCVESADDIGEVRDPAAWLGEGVSRMPASAVRVRQALLKPGEWEVLESTAEVMRMVQPMSIGTAMIVARTVDGRRRMTTGVRLTPGKGRLLWALIAPFHRKTARGVVAHKVEDAS